MRTGRKANAPATLEQRAQEAVHTAASRQLTSKLQAGTSWGQCLASRPPGAARRQHCHADCRRPAGRPACPLLLPSRHRPRAARAQAPARLCLPRTAPRRASPPLGSGRPQPARLRPPAAAGVRAGSWSCAAGALDSGRGADSARRPRPAGTRARGARAARARLEARRRARAAWPAHGTPWPCPGPRGPPSRPWPALRSGRAGGRVVQNQHRARRSAQTCARAGARRAALLPRPCRAAKASIHSRSSRCRRAASPAAAFISEDGQKGRDFVGLFFGLVRGSEVSERAPHQATGCSVVGAAGAGRGHGPEQAAGAAGATAPGRGA